MGTHSSILAWRISWTEQPGRLVHGVAESDMTEQLGRLTHEFCSDVGAVLGPTLLRTSGAGPHSQPWLHITFT